MGSLKYTYSDSVAGLQSEEFEKLSDIIKYLEDFGWYGDSEGIIFQNNENILEYESRENGITWKK